MFRNIDVLKECILSIICLNKTEAVLSTEKSSREKTNESIITNAKYL